MKSQADAPEARAAAAPRSHRATACPRCHGSWHERVWVSAGYERIVTCECKREPFRLDHMSLSLTGPSTDIALTAGGPLEFRSSPGDFDFDPCEEP